jgi:hypothetical protein
MMSESFIKENGITLFICIYFLTSFSGKTMCQTRVKVSDSSSKHGVTTIFGHNYFFEPDTSTISGTLKVEMYYGPPDFGETPSTDSKEYVYIFYPVDTINVIQQVFDSAGFDVTAKNVIKFQLSPLNNLSLHPYINKKIKITGQFFGALTGHHHTDVLMAVTKAEL